jgi:sirohydrochlorin ferrochelatase
VTVLLGVAHGSKDPASQAVVREVLERAAARRPGLRTADAYVDNASPSIRRALAALADEGVDDVAVVPLLLTAAVALQDRRRGLGAGGRRDTRACGCATAARSARTRRWSRWRRSGSPRRARPDDPVVLVAGGSLDPDANAVRGGGRAAAAGGAGLRQRRRRLRLDRAADGAEALERLRPQGCTRAAVALWFVGPGFLPRLVGRLAGEARGSTSPSPRRWASPTPWPPSSSSGTTRPCSATCG